MLPVLVGVRRGAKEEDAEDEDDSDGDSDDAVEDDDDEVCRSGELPLECGDLCLERVFPLLSISEAFLSAVLAASLPVLVLCGLSCERCGRCDFCITP